MSRHTSRTPECPRCKQDGLIHCDRCNGSGRAIGDAADCPRCKGAGNLGPTQERYEAQMAAAKRWESSQNSSATPEQRRRPG